MKTLGEVAGGWGGQGKVWTPFANNGFTKKDFPPLRSPLFANVSFLCCLAGAMHGPTRTFSPRTLCNHGCSVNRPYVSSLGNSGKVGTKYMATPAWQAASQAHPGCLLVPGALDMEEDGVEDFQKEGQTRKCLESPKGWRFPGISL